jgi:hypothetical protein
MPLNMLAQPRCRVTQDCNNGKHFTHALSLVGGTSAVQQLRNSSHVDTKQSGTHQDKHSSHGTSDVCMGTNCTHLQLSIAEQADSAEGDPHKVLAALYVQATSTTP